VLTLSEMGSFPQSAGAGGWNQNTTSKTADKISVKMQHGAPNTANSDMQLVN